MGTNGENIELLLLIGNYVIMWSPEPKCVWHPCLRLCFYRCVNVGQWHRYRVMWTELHYKSKTPCIHLNFALDRVSDLWINARSFIWKDEVDHPEECTADCVSSSLGSVYCFFFFSLFPIISPCPRRFLSFNNNKTELQTVTVLTSTLLWFVKTN